MNQGDVTVKGENRGKRRMPPGFWVAWKMMPYMQRGKSAKENYFYINLCYAVMAMEVVLLR